MTHGNNRLEIYSLISLFRKLACLKEQLKGCRLQECLPAVLSSAFHFLQTLSHTTGSTQSPSNEEQATACSRVCDNRQEVSVLEHPLLFSDSVPVANTR